MSVGASIQACTLYGMYFVKIETRPSELDGLGLFTLHDLPEGTIVGTWGVGVRVMDEPMLERLEPRSPLLARTAARWFACYFLHKASWDDVDPDEHVNHSPDPNLLYVCGWLLTRRNIAAGEELTLDYRQYFRTDEAQLIGKDPVVGYSPRQALLQSIDELRALLARLPEDWTGAPPARAAQLPEPLFNERTRRDVSAEAE